MNKSRLDELLDRFPALHILVVGDFFLDKYLIIDPALSEISLETGLEAYQVVEIRHSPGAAGTVVSNLRAMEIQVSAVGVIGQDGEGFELRQDLRRMGVNIDGLIEAPDRFTPTYTKPMLRSADGPEREINRLDVKNRQLLSVQYEEDVVDQLERLVPGVDGVIIADQVQERNCGVITAGMRATLARLAQAYPSKPFAADSRVRIGEFEQVIIKPNLHEAEAAVQALAEHLPPETRICAEPPFSSPKAETDGLAPASMYGSTLFQKNQKPIFVTLGALGILVVSGSGLEHVPGVPVTGEIDIVGAGDSVMAGLMAGLCAGGTAKEAAFLGNMAASITIQQLSTTGTASRQQLRQQFGEPNTPNDRDK